MKVSDVEAMTKKAQEEVAMEIGKLKVQIGDMVKIERQKTLTTVESTKRLNTKKGSLSGRRS